MPYAKPITTKLRVSTDKMTRLPVFIGKKYRTFYTTRLLIFIY